MRRFVALILNDLHLGVEDTERARVMFYGAKLLADLIDHSALERRLEALERRAYAPKQQAAQQ